MIELIYQLKNAIMLGSQYALVAIGFTLFFGVLNVVVFCHGGFYILATFLGAGLIGIMAGASGLSPFLFGTMSLLALFLAMTATGIVGIGVERTTIRPFRNSPMVMTILSTIGVGIIIEQLIKIFYPAGSNPQTFPDIFPPTGVRLGFLYISTAELAILGVTALSFVLIWLFIKKTRMGSEIVAISQDFEAAMFVGINVDRAVAVTFFLGAALAAVAGFMNGIYFTVFRYDMGAMAGIKGFSAAVVGGLGSIFGAVIGGFLMAFVETMSAAYIPGGSAIRDVFSFGVLLLFLIFRPSGILGEIKVEKV